MSEDKQFDFWYAVNNTELVLKPSAQLETFGDTIVNYALICEQMDAVNTICIREGQLKALKPTIITPSALGQVDLENFGSEAQAYAEWLKEHAQNLRILQYGFTLHKQELKQHTVTDRLENVVERVKKEVASKDDPLGAILIGVDSPWEVCLLKLMVELVQESAQGNMQQMQKQALVEKKQYLDRIDQAFAKASREPGRINSLATMLKREGLWEQYEDRFFALVRASQK
jgi:hypothetical protein